MWLEYVERNTEDVVMRTWKMEVDGHQKKTECYKKRHEGERSKDRRNTRPENVEIDSMHRPQIGKRPNKKK